MSEMGTIIEYSEDVAEAEAPKALPASDYPVTITGAELGVSQNSGKKRVAVTFTVAPEDYPADYEDAESFPDGKTVMHYVGAEDNLAARFRMRKFCEAIGVPASKNIDINSWVGREAVAALEPDEFEGIERERCKSVKKA